MAPNWWQHIWVNDCLGNLCIYAALGLSKDLFCMRRWPNISYTQNSKICIQREFYLVIGVINSRTGLCLWLHLYFHVNNGKYAFGYFAFAILVSSHIFEGPMTYNVRPNIILIITSSDRAIVAPQRHATYYHSHAYCGDNRTHRYMFIDSTLSA